MAEDVKEQLLRYLNDAYAAFLPEYSRSAGTSRNRRDC